jgi:lipoprotein NlpD
MRLCRPFPLKLPLRFPLVLVAVVLVMAGCATRRPVPVEDRAVSRNESPRVVAPARVPSATAASEAPPGATYTVKRGDTLHQIALDSGLDYRELAAWNNIDNVNRIVPGQVLRLTAPGTPGAIAAQDATSGVTTAPLRSPPAIVEGMPPATVPPGVAATPPSVAPAPSAGADLKTSPKAVKLPYSEQAVRDLDLAASAAPAPRSSPTPPSTPAPAASAPPATAAPSAPPASASAGLGDADHLDWAWPAKGKIVSGFSETANLKGIDIAGTAGEAVRASAPGRVVYAGNGLRGYGKLIIIKHNATYLSAYAHNRDILVKEGQQVTRGQKIAEMGNTDADQVKLHFEIRRQGKPMDPAKFLPSS